MGTLRAPIGSCRRPAAPADAEGGEPLDTTRAVQARTLGGEGVGLWPLHGGAVNRGIEACPALPVRHTALTRRWRSTGALFMRPAGKCCSLSPARPRVQLRPSFAPTDLASHILCITAGVGWQHRTLQTRLLQSQSAPPCSLRLRPDPGKVTRARALGGRACSRHQGRPGLVSTAATCRRRSPLACLPD